MMWTLRPSQNTNWCTHLKEGRQTLQNPPSHEESPLLYGTCYSTLAILKPRVTLRTLSLRQIYWKQREKGPTEWACCLPVLGLLLIVVWQRDGPLVTSKPPIAYAPCVDQHKRVLITRRMSDHQGIMISMAKYGEEWQRGRQCAAPKTSINRSCSESVVRVIVVALEIDCLGINVIY